MKKITQTTERKLMHVIEKTAELVNGGMTPNDAIIKSASESQIRPGEISLVVHAYNTGRTSRQRNDGDDPFEKAAEFALADTAVILEAMYPTSVKTAAAAVSSTVVSPEYSFSPVPMLERKLGHDKRAQAGIDWRSMGGVQITAPPPLPTDQQHRMKVAAATVDRLQTGVEESRRKMASAFDQMGKTFSDLTTYFRRPDAHPIPVVKEAVLLMHGDKGVQLIDQLVHVTPSLMKLGSHTLGQSLVGVSGRSRFGVSMPDLDCTAEPFDTIARFMGQLHDYRTKKAEYAATVAHYEQEAGAVLGPFVNPAVSQSILDTSSDTRDKSAGFDFTDPLKLMGTYSLAKNTLGPMAAKMKGPDDGVKLTKAITALNDPVHEQKLREINTQAMLQDLMLNDPVISGYDPHEVTGAFNDINQISPSVSDQRMLMQSLMRKRLQQGQLDTFEQDQLLGFEDKLRRQFQPVTGGKADGSVI